MGTRRPKTPSPDGTMICPDCGGSGRELNHYGEYSFETVKHDEDRCRDEDLHWVREARDGSVIAHRHYIRCLRCGGGGRVQSPERLLNELLLVLKAATWK